MKRQILRSQALIGILGIISLLILAGVSLAGNPELRQIREELGQFREKVSPVLLDEVVFTKAHPAYNRPIPVIVKVKKEYFNEDLENRRQLGRSQRNMLKGIRSYTGRLTSRQIEALMASDQVEYVTLDVPIRATGHISNEDDPVPMDTLRATLGLDLVRAAGKGVTVAVFDSGIGEHVDLEPDRIKVAVDFTSGRRKTHSNGNQDEYGHGTHVAGIIGGTGAASNGQYAGVAERVRFVDVKVIGSDGSGQTSHLIKAIDWAVDNKKRYDIQVANLSLGHPPVESYQDDPLCQAVERLVDAGIVTIVSAGNLGKLEGYPEIWGGITTPGIDPKVITVGAINTQGTLTHKDDIATSFSSRGPALDNQFKPDLCAPGNKVASLRVTNSYIDTTYPTLRVAALEDTAGTSYTALSGTSAATPFVTGTVAIMLERNGELKPWLVKRLLAITAVKLDQPNMLEQGNGLLNSLKAVRVAANLDVDTLTLNKQVSPSWILDGEEVWAGGTYAIEDRIIYSEWVDPALPYWGEGVFWSDNFLGFGALDGVFWTDASFWIDFAGLEGVFWTNSIFSLEGVFWTDSILSLEGVFWTDSWFNPKGVFWSEGRLESANAHDLRGDE